ncbi:uncharacterized protein LOC121733107 [Aricia agestis]|uniref:uncharacterized protein LOC121733107 n=1 Tax=Aricia agestis TaxID=91739 RepID=UPI001C2094CA|nr:uncharacterized protein LOC121733107 [Aricia agestis]
MECARPLSDILSEKQVGNILDETLSSGCRVVGYDIAPASEGLSGFLGEHYRVKLVLREGRKTRELRIFVKMVPRLNAPKAEFIHKYKFNLRESIMFKYIAESGAADDESPWCAKAYIYNEHILVMPDLSVEGYRVQPFYECLDLDHVLVTVRSLANFHATLANLFTRKLQIKSQRESLLADLEYTTADPTFKDSPWLRASAKLTANIFTEFSLNRDKVTKNFEEDIYKQFLEGCADLRENPDTLNTIIHKDLWVNNIMFKYQDGAPVNAILIDYQCIRYGPPAFDLMSLLYLTTSKTFREENEAKLMEYYFSVFTERLDYLTRMRLQDLQYDLATFLRLCEMARKFGMVHTIAIFPYTLMDPCTAQATFDDPKTYVKYLEDRSEPVIAHARRCSYYRDRQVDVIEEFVERYL